MEKYISQIAALPVSARVERLKEEMLAEPRFVSIEQARIITRSTGASFPGPARRPRKSSAESVRT